MFLLKRIKVLLFLRGLAIKHDLPIPLFFIKKRDRDSFTLFVKSSPHWQKLLLSLQLNSFFKDFLIESEPFLSSDGNSVCYSFVRYKKSYRYDYRTERDFLSTIKKGSLIIDKRTVIKFGHFIISGQTGAGKSYALFSLLAQLYKQKAIIGIIDPKSSELALIGKKIAKGLTATNNESIIGLARLFVNLLQKRKKLFFEKGRIGDDYKTLKKRPLFLIIDEFASLRLALNKKENDEFIGLVSRLVLEGRQLGIFVIIALQKADSVIIPTSLREQVSFSCVLGASGTQTYKVLLGEDFNKKNYPEMGVGKGIANLNGQLKVVEFPFFAFDLNSFFKDSE